MDIEAQHIPVIPNISSVRNNLEKHPVARKNETFDKQINVLELESEKTHEEKKVASGVSKYNFVIIALVAVVVILLLALVYYIFMSQKECSPPQVMSPQPIQNYMKEQRYYQEPIQHAIQEVEPPNLPEEEAKYETPAVDELNDIINRVSEIDTDTVDEPEVDNEETVLEVSNEETDAPEKEAPSNDFIIEDDDIFTLESNMHDPDIVNEFYMKTRN